MWLFTEGIAWFTTAMTSLRIGTWETWKLIKCPYSWSNRVQRSITSQFRLTMAMELTRIRWAQWRVCSLSRLKRTSKRCSLRISTFCASRLDWSAKTKRTINASLSSLFSAAMIPFKCTRFATSSLILCFSILFKQEFWLMARQVPGEDQISEPH